MVNKVDRLAKYRLEKTALRDEWIEDIAVIDYWLDQSKSMRRTFALRRLKILINGWIKDLNLK